MRRLVNAAVAMLVIVGFAVAAEYQALVTKLEDGKVLVTVFKKGDKKGEERTFKAKTFKISKTEGDKTEDVTVEEAKKLIEDSKGKIKGFRAKITTEGEGDEEKVTKIEITKGKKK